MNKYEKITSMDIDELTKFLCANFNCKVCDAKYFLGKCDSGTETMTQWLESEA